MKNKNRKIKILIILISTLLFAFAFTPLMFGPGIETATPMGAYLNGVFPSTTPSGDATTEVSYGVENAFPNLIFTDPVDMVELPGGDEFVVIGKQGHIWKIANEKNTNSKDLLLDISDNVVSFADGGMLGLVLHPEYGVVGSQNAEFIYVFYRYTPVQGTDLTAHRVNGYMRLSRFNFPLGATAINPASEQVLINVFDRHDWHNGGDMFFGPTDGFLYLAIGDEGLANDFYNVTQQIDKWLFGGVLRIDVDQRGGQVSHAIRRQPLDAGTPPTGWPSSFTQGYFIPNDNPWQDTSGGILEEFYAIGTRSPHRMTIDKPTGDIWLGDIGQGAKEEISLVRKGDNLQWPYMEGDQNGAKAKPNVIIGTERPPIHAYGRSTGRAVIGGFVYRGNRYPELNEKYIFGDHETQDVWTLTKTGENTGNRNFLLNVPVEGTGNKDGISSFFIDSNEYVYILDLFGNGEDGGVIRKVVRTSAVIDPPQKLSDLNVFSDLESLTPVDGIIPYDVNAPLWSDGAKKRRWIALPNNGTHNTALEQIDFEGEENWKFPSGTVAIKHFELPTDENDPTKVTKLETRFLVFTEENDAYAVTYKWNEEQTDAILISIDEEVEENYEVTKRDGSIVNQTWNFPTRSQCIQCHNSVTGYALGLKTRQLNKSYTYPLSGVTSNQLETWNHLNMFNDEIEPYTELPASANINSTLASDEMKVRSYIDANCAYCHRPNGVEGAFDGRTLTALYDQEMINTEVISHASASGYSIVKPEDHDNSMLYMRDVSTGDDRMPPIGRNLVDEDYLEELIGWIDGLDVDGPATIEEGWYTLQAQHSDKFLAVENASSSTDARAVQISSSIADNANWYVEHKGNKKYKIKARHSDMVLSLKDLRSGQGSNVIQEPWNEEQHQLWYFEENSNGVYTIVNAYNGLGLDVFGGQSFENQHTIVWKRHGRKNQDWKVTPSKTDFAVIGETGKVKVDHNWLTVNLNNTYLNPVVVAGGAGYDGKNQSTVRLQNVTNTSFQLRIVEWACLDQSHILEDIPYIVVEAGIHELPNGKNIRAGTIDQVNEDWYTHQFNQAFNEEPLVFGQAVTTNEAEAVTIFFDERNTSATQMRLKLKEQDKAVGGHAYEKVSWIAVESGSFLEEDRNFEFKTTGRSVDHTWSTINFDQEFSANSIFIGEIGTEHGGDAAVMRYKELSNSSVQVFVEEEICGDSEIAHTTEEIHYMAFNAAGNVYGTTLEESLVASTLMASVSNDGFYFTDISTINDSHIVDVKWTTSNDKKVETYVIEKSTDGFNFVVVTDQSGLKSSEKSRYKAYDENPVIGRSVYRILAKMTDGQEVYSHNIEMQFDLFRTNMLVYPSMIENSQLLTVDIIIQDIDSEDLVISIYNISGALIRTRPIHLDEVQSFEQFKIEDLKSGLYIVEVKGADWVQMQKFVVK